MTEEDEPWPAAPRTKARLKAERSWLRLHVRGEERGGRGRGEDAPLGEMTRSYVCQKRTCGAVGESQALKGALHCTCRRPGRRVGGNTSIEILNQSGQGS